jgi:hypothetical protein
MPGGLVTCQRVDITRRHRPARAANRSVSRKLRKVPPGNRGLRLSQLYGGNLVKVHYSRGVGGDELVGNLVTAVDEAVLARLRDAIATEDVDEEEQLKGVLRMLGEEIPEQNQLHLLLTSESSEKPQ